MKHQYLQLIATMLFGGLAGNMFTYLAKRPDPTFLTYAVTTTPFGSANVSIPGLKIKIGNKTVPTISTHVIEIGMQRGPFLQQIEVSIEFSKPVQFLGPIIAAAPDGSRQIVCIAQSNTVLRCKLGPFQRGQGLFRITAFTEQASSPKVLNSEDPDKVRLVGPTDLSLGPDPVILGLHINLVTILFILLAGVIGAMLATSSLTGRFIKL